MPEWEKPEIFKLTSGREVDDVANEYGVQFVMDEIDILSNELFELRHTSEADNDIARQKFVGEMKAEGVNYGRWVHLPWRSALVHMHDETEHYELRTFRNIPLIEKSEQQALRSVKLAAFGLSVGSNVIDNTAITGIGNEYLLFDPDRLETANLNRIRASVADVGLLKTEIAGRKIFDLDPYVNQKHFTEGYNEQTDDILRAERPDLIIEEVDDLRVKAQLRRIASELAIPIVMAGDAGDTATLDIERYDLNGTKPFNGKLNRKEYDALLDGTYDDQESALIKILGLKNLSPRLFKSATMRGRKEIGGFPQLGTTAASGGSVASVAARDILLGRKISSASRAHNIRKSAGSPAPTNLRENAEIFYDFATRKKTQGKSASESEAIITELPDTFEIPRLDNKYTILAATAESNSALAIKAQQLHGVSYVGEGYFTEDALEADGRLVPELDGTRDRADTNVRVNYLLASENGSVEDSFASLRLIDALDAESVTELPTYQYFENDFDDSVKERLQTLVGEHGRGSVREIAALARVGRHARGSYELMRSVMQNALIKHTLTGHREVYIASLTEVSLGPIEKLVGPNAIERLWKEKQIFSEDPRGNDIMVTPVLIDPMKILDGIINALESEGVAEDARAVHKLTKTLHLFTDGLSREQMGERAAHYIAPRVADIA